MYLSSRGIYGYSSEEHMPRLYRGVTFQFAVAFFEDSDRTQPIVPGDPSKYPAYDIRDPDNNSVQTGVGVASSGAGYWLTQPWSVPMDAPLSTPEKYVSQALPDGNVPDGTARFWRVDWVIADVAGRELQYSESFEVLALPTTVSKDRSQVYAVPAGKTARVSIRSPATYDSIDFELSKSTTPEKPTLTIADVQNMDLGDPYDASKINRQRDGETFVYFVDLDASNFTKAVDYQVMWTTRDSVVSEYDYLHQQIYCFDRRWLNYTKPVYMLIDRLQKAADTYQAYTQGDVIEYLRRAMDMLNAWHPANTNWTISTFPSGQMDPYLVVMASIYALQAQYLLEGELSANFSGQTITLDWDHTGMLDGMISKLQEFMNNMPQGGGFSVVKEAWYRRMNPVGVVAVRPYRWSSRGTYVFKASSGTGASQVIELLSGFGLL
jgi:hypothetical protein